VTVAVHTSADTPRPIEHIVDAHVHIWDPAHVTYPWLAEVPRLNRRFTLDDVEAELIGIGVGQVVLVQAADSIDETRHMLETARVDRRVAGVVAWVPIDDVALAVSWLDSWSTEPIVGARHLVHRYPDPDLLLGPRVRDVLDLLAERHLTFDVCAESPHLLGLVLSLAERHPDLTLVVDHLAKPPIRTKEWKPWATLLAAAAQAPNVVAKLSGLNTAAARHATAADFRPYVEHALDVFGPHRIMYGGDWPFALLAADSYTEIWNELRGSIDHLDAASRRAVLSGTAQRVYRLTTPLPTTLPTPEPSMRSPGRRRAGGRR
jgi:L-fuconolactonase